MNTRFDPHPLDGHTSSGEEGTVSHARLAAAFTEFSSLSLEEQQARLDELRQSDRALWDAVHPLLAIAAKPGSVLDASLGQVVSNLAPVDVEDSGQGLPKSIGPYEVVRLLGKGGMGNVYEAQAMFPRRRVALKVLTDVVLTHEVLSRFRHEAQALAKLEHPGIARMYEARIGKFETGERGEANARGVTAGGTNGGEAPFIAMELVDGVDLFSYACKFASSDRQALHMKVQLLMQICEAVEHAHQRGLIHRDLKPSNVLVVQQEANEQSDVPTRAGPRAKVLDFGIARLVQVEGTSDRTYMTAGGSVLGTPGYMSPEQADGKEIDIRSDVFCLGILLFETLTNQRAFVSARRGLAEAIKAAKEVDPPPLSTFVPKVDVDLEVIVQTALTKDPLRRYQSAGALRQDLERWLADEPILARRPGRVEQIARFVRKNRAMAGGIGIAFCALLLGAGVATWQAVIATKEKQRAEGEAAVADGSLELMRGFLRAAGPEARMGKQVTVMEMLSSASERMLEGSRERTLPAAAAHRFMAWVFSDMGEPGQSLKHAEIASELEQSLRGQAAEASIDASIVRAKALTSLGRRAEARAITEAALRIASEALSPTSATMIRLRLINSNAQDDEQAAVAMLEQVVADVQKDPSVTPQDLAGLQHDLAVSLMNQGDFVRGKELIDNVAKVYLGTFGADHPSTLYAQHNQATLLSGSGKAAEALPLMTSVVERRERILGLDHNSTMESLVQLALIHARMGEPGKGVAPLTKAFERRTKLLGSNHSKTLFARGLLVDLHMAMGKLPTARQWLDGLYDGAVASSGKGSSEAITAASAEWNYAEATKDREGMIKWALVLEGTKMWAPVVAEMKSKDIDIEQIARERAGTK